MRKSIKDYRAERGEYGRWVRIHIEPRTGKFDSGRAPKGPGRKTRRCTTRRTQGIFDDGETCDKSAEWQFQNDDQETLFLTQSILKSTALTSDGKEQPRLHGEK